MVVTVSSPGARRNSRSTTTLPGPEGGPTTVWQAGTAVEVAFGIWANHGGGYSYRLCKNDPGTVNEECFQRTALKFLGETQWLQHTNGTRIEIPMVKLSEGTYPEGSEWARLPFPECKAKPALTRHKLAKRITAWVMFAMISHTQSPSQMCMALATIVTEPIPIVTDFTITPLLTLSSSRRTFLKVTICFHGVGTVKRPCRFGRTASTSRS